MSRELQTIMSSGELNGLYLTGVTASDKVLKQSEVVAITDALDVRVASLEISHSILLIATSVATSQEPTGLDTPLQIEFGPLQTTTDVDVSAAGAFTFNTTGRYIMSPFFQYGRTGSTGTSELLNRILLNGAQLGSSLSARIDSADTLVPWSSSIILSVTAGDIITIEIMRDSAGNNSGGIFAVNPTLAGWNDAPCASVQIYKVN